MPGTELVTDVGDLDGRSRLALRRRGRVGEHDLLVDPATGHDAGQHIVTSREFEPGVPPGTVRYASSVLTSVVDGPGELPARLPRDGVPG